MSQKLLLNKIKLLVIPFALLLGGCQTTTKNVEAGEEIAFKNMLNAVVRIDVREANYDSGTRRFVRGVGSGVILDAEGYILTNAHVVSPQATEILITLASLERVKGELVGWDHWTDLALIRILPEELESGKHQFTWAEFGDSNALFAGQTVYAAGTPNGLTRTVTKGIISNPNRYFAASSQIRGYETGYFNTWLQTDAAINPGNSGGPLVDQRGKVIGINTRSYLGANNLSFAVPINIAKAILPQLKNQGNVSRSYAGIQLAPLQDLETFYGLDANRGALIESVDPNSPADQIGLQAGDILMSIEGNPVDGRFPEQLPPILYQLSQFEIGNELDLVIRRSGENLTKSITTEPLQSRMGDRWSIDTWGVSIQDLTKPIARERQLKNEDGVMVIGVQTAFPAEKAGLYRGDIITSVNRQKIQTLNDLKELIGDEENSNDRVLLEVNRNHQVSFVVLRID